MLPIIPLAACALLIGGTSHPAVRHNQPRVSVLPRCCADEQPIDVEVADDTYEACMKMRVSELKAELDLRKIDYTNMFEKDEVRLLLLSAHLFVASAL